MVLLDRNRKQTIRPHLIAAVFGLREPREAHQVPQNGVEYEVKAPERGKCYLPLGWCRVHSTGRPHHRFVRRDVVRVTSKQSSILRQISYGRNIGKNECYLDYDGILELAPERNDESGQTTAVLQFCRANTWERHFLFYLQHPDSTIAASYRIAFASVVLGLASVLLSVVIFCLD
jgi:hypothetical protein